MDAFTHGLAGAVIARAAFEPALGKWGLVTGIVVALLPDIDFSLKFINKRWYIKYHRSFANSIFFLIPISLFWGSIFHWISGLHRLPYFIGLTFLVLCSHIFFDTLNPFGTMIFAPFSNYRFSLDVVYLVDFVFSSLLFFPLMASYIWPSHSSLICYGSLISLALYIIFRFMNHAQANKHNRHYIEANQLKSNNFASLPTYHSPFRWNNLIETSDCIYKGGINTLERKAYRSTYRSWPKYSHMNQDENFTWIQRALELPQVKTYLWFARFPVMRYQGFIHNSHRVALYDFRFDGFKGRLPFVFIVDFHPSGRVRTQGFHRNWNFQLLLKQKRFWINNNLDRSVS
jgi:inner membrane protein